MKNRRERLLPDGTPKYVRCYDNGGKSFDRFTVVFTGRYRHNTGGQFIYVGMSCHPFHPQGFGQHGSSDTQIDTRPGGWAGPSIGRKHETLGTRIGFNELPPDCQKLVMSDYCDLWSLKKLEHSS